MPRRAAPGRVFGRVSGRAQPPQHSALHPANLAPTGARCYDRSLRVEPGKSFAINRPASLVASGPGLAQSPSAGPP